MNNNFKNEIANEFNFDDLVIEAQDENGLAFLGTKSDLFPSFNDEEKTEKDDKDWIKALKAIAAEYNFLPVESADKKSIYLKLTDEEIDEEIDNEDETNEDEEDDLYIDEEDETSEDDSEDEEDEEGNKLDKAATLLLKGVKVEDLDIDLGIETEEEREARIKEEQEAFEIMRIKNKNKINLWLKKDNEE